MLTAKQPVPPDAGDNCGSYQPLLGGEQGRHISCAAASVFLLET